MSPAAQAAFATALRDTYVRAGALQAGLEEQRTPHGLNKPLLTYCAGMKVFIQLCNPAGASVGFAADLLPHARELATLHRLLATRVRRLSKKARGLDAVTKKMDELRERLDDVVEDLRDSVDFAPDAEAAHRTLAQ